MNFRRVGASGLVLSEIGLGTWLSANSARCKGQDFGAVAQRAYERGVRFFDSADVYVAGAAERCLGEALAGYPASEHVVTSKCFFPFSGERLNRGLSRKHVVDSVRGSLNRLGRSTLDVFFCHRFDADVPVREVVLAMKFLVESGLCHYWATSEWPIDALGEAISYADSLGAPYPVADQYELNVLNYHKRFSRAEELAALGVGAIAWSPLAGGLLTGKYREDVPKESRFGTYAQLRENLGNTNDLERANAFASLCDERGLDPIHASIRFLLQEERICSVIVGATASGHVDAVCSAREAQYGVADHDAILSFSRAIGHHRSI